MSSIGTGYDLSASQFSPDGRVFQVEYAGKAVENSGTVVALRSEHGVVFGVEKLIGSKLYEHGANKRVFHIDKHIGMAVAGLISDARQIVEIARKESAHYQSQYGVPIPVKYLSRRIAYYMHTYTLYSAVRPYGCSVALCSYDKVDGTALYIIEPSGVCNSYQGYAIGKAQQSAKTEIEKLINELNQFSMEKLVENATKIIYQIHDELKDKNFELEMSWISAADPVHKTIPKDKIEEAEKKAKATLQNDSESEDEPEAVPEAEAEAVAVPTVAPVDVAGPSNEAEPSAADEAAK